MTKDRFLLEVDIGVNLINGYGYWIIEENDGYIKEYSYLDYNNILKFLTIAYKTYLKEKTNTQGYHWWLPHYGTSLFGVSRRAYLRHVEDSMTTLDADYLKRILDEGFEKTLKSKFVNLFYNKVITDFKIINFDVKNQHISTFLIDCQYGR